MCVCVLICIFKYIYIDIKEQICQIQDLKAIQQQPRSISPNKNLLEIICPVHANEILEKLKNFIYITIAIKS